MIEISVKEERVEGQGKSNIIMFHLLDILYFVSPFIGWGTFGCPPKKNNRERRYTSMNNEVILTLKDINSL